MNKILISLIVMTACTATNTFSTMAKPVVYQTGAEYINAKQTEITKYESNLNTLKANLQNKLDEITKMFKSAFGPGSSANLAQGVTLTPDETAALATLNTRFQKSTSARSTIENSIKQFAAATGLVYHANIGPMPSRPMPVYYQTGAEYIAAREAEITKYENSLNTLKANLQTKLDETTMILKTAFGPGSPATLAEGVTLTPEETTTLSQLNERFQKSTKTRGEIERSLKQFATAAGLQYRTNIGPMY